MVVTYNANGQHGFVFQTPGPGKGAWEQPVMSASSPDPLGIAWGINLAAWRGRGPQQKLGAPQLRARIRWGGGAVGGSGAEEALIDYPAQGTTVCVFGSQVKVDLVGVTAGLGISDIPPVASGWLSYGRTSGRWTATLTELPVVPNTVAVFNVPQRARGYRIANLTATNQLVVGAQFNGQATPLARRSDAIMGGNNLYDAANASAYYPLAYDAATLQVAVTTAEDLIISWLIELG